MNTNPGHALVARRYGQSGQSGLMRFIAREDMNPKKSDWSQDLSAGSIWEFRCKNFKIRLHPSS